MWPDRVSNPGPLTYEPGALPTALRGPAFMKNNRQFIPYLSLSPFSLSESRYWDSADSLIRFNTAVLSSSPDHVNLQHYDADLFQARIPTVIF